MPKKSQSLSGGGSATAGIPHIVVTKKAVTGLRNLYTFSLKHFRKKKRNGKSTGSHKPHLLVLSLSRAQYWQGIRKLSSAHN